MRNKVITVFYHQHKVGRIAQTKEGVCAFEYDGEWLRRGFSISPRFLPLEKRVFIAPKEPFDGNFGVFNDSLPDGWGQLLIDRLLVKKGLNPAAVSVLDRLAMVGTQGMGALEYQPEETIASDKAIIHDINELAQEVSEILREKEPSEKSLFDLVQLAGSSGGARPKALLNIEGEEWLVKFPASSDPQDIGKQEYYYSVMARKAGLDVPETRLLEGKYFAVKRFDRVRGQKIHKLSASGLLQASHRWPSLDYTTLLNAALQLSRDYREVEKLFRLMCFNVFTHNRDDHAKNFSFLYDQDHWIVSPAYDLLYTTGMGGEHATSIDGEGKNPTSENILNVARQVGLDLNRAKEILNLIKNLVRDRGKMF
jgi:serine/threonine-protein kinase HipA